MQNPLTEIQSIGAEAKQLGNELKSKATQATGGNAPVVTGQPARRTLPVDKVNPVGKGKYGSRPGEVRIPDQDIEDMVRPLGGKARIADQFRDQSEKKPLDSYPPLYDCGGRVMDKGGNIGKVNVLDGKHVAAILKVGERVLTPEQNEKYEKDHNMKTGTDHAHAALAGKDGKPKKEIKEMTIRRLHDGKLHVKHTHHHGEHHGEEEQAMDLNQLHDHLDQHLGTPSDGEPQPAGGAAPAPMTAAPSPMPPMQE
jgi:hypothetical protein